MGVIPVSKIEFSGMPGPGIMLGLMTSTFPCPECDLWASLTILPRLSPHVVRNFTPALPRFELRYDVIEALARGLGHLQVAIAEPRRRLLGLKRVHGNAGLAGNPCLMRSRDYVHTISDVEPLL